MEMENRKKQAGFTLLELLVVLAIMGFLLAMVAPRLVGIFGGAEETVCETNIKRMVQYSTVYEVQHSALPQRMIVPAYRGADGTWRGPAVENLGVDGREAITTTLRDQLRLTGHNLTFGEVREIVNRLGINEVVVLNNPYDIENPDPMWGNPPGAGNEAHTMEVVNIHEIAAQTNLDAEATDLIWPMVGGGATGGGYIVNNTEWNAIDHAIGSPDLAYRLLLGVGLDSSIAERTIVTAGQCPVFAGDDDPEVVWGWYGMVLPRLEATVGRLGADSFLTVDAQACTDDVPAEMSQEVTFDLTEVQDRADFAIVCPEGCLFAARACEWDVKGFTTQ